MRHLLIALLAFVAGVSLVLWLPRHSPLSANVMPVKRAAPAIPASSPAEGGADASDDGSERWPAAGPTPEQVLYAQPRMLRDALAGMSPRVAGRPNLYLLVFAGDGGEDVFRNEAEYAAHLFSGRFGPTAHSLVLENNPASLSSHPLASWSNLETALDGLGRVMNVDQDILLLYVTSHGGVDHTLLVDMDPLPLDQIGAGDLAGILGMRRFKWKVVVVNACYSGGFVAPLRGAGTLVLTAARSDRSSFGCGSDSDATYFGKAWLVDGLNRTPDFIDAFRRARGEIARWEQQDKLTPSEPQIDIGNGIAGQLALWRRGFVAGPAIPFAPAPGPTGAGSVTSP